MIEYVLTDLNIEYYIMCDSLVHNLARVHFLHTNRQRGISTKHTLQFRIVEYVLIIALNIKYEIMFDSLVDNFARVHFLHTNMQKDIAIKYTYSIF